MQCALACGNFCIATQFVLMSSHQLDSGTCVLGREQPGASLGRMGSSLADLDLSTKFPVLLIAPCALVLLTGYVVWLRLLPKPLPGIPYNPEALKSVFGDVASIIQWKKRHGEQRRWFQAQAVKMNTPICQVFTKPFFYGPQVILTDHREIHDIFHRRFKEFDKGYKEAEAFGGIIPDELLSLKLSSPEYKFHKDLMRDLMLPQFLNSVNAPEIYDKAMLLVDLWKLKANITQGRPFIFKDDIHKAALDIIMAVSFGLEHEDSCTQKQLHDITRNHIEDQTSAPYEPYYFEELPMETDPAAITTLAASVEVGFNSPLPVQHHWFLRQLPHLGGAVKTKNAMMRRKINESLARMPVTDDEALESARTALDNMLYRERLLANKAGRRPNFHASYIYDEVSQSNLGFWKPIIRTDTCRCWLTLSLVTTQLLIPFRGV